MFNKKEKLLAAADPGFSGEGDLVKFCRKLHENEEN